MRCLARCQILGIDASSLAVAWAMLFVASNAALPADPAKPRPASVFYELRSDGTNWKKLFEVPDYHPCNSPRITADGTRLSFDAWKAHEGETLPGAQIVSCRLDGTDLKVHCVGAMPSWSPDGKRFACCRYNAQQGVWTMDADGGNAQLLDRAGWGIQWSPDGAAVAYSRGPNVVVRQVASGEERLLFPENGSPYIQIYWNMTWSSDSRRIAMTAGTAAGTREIAIIDVQGAEFGFKRRAVGQFNPMLSWNGDGKRLVFPEKFGTVTELRELDPSAAEPTRPVPGIPSGLKIASGCWTPDGERLIILCNSR